jgi:hypothetical protein
VRVMLRGEVIEVETTWCGSGGDADAQCVQLHRRLKRIVRARGALDAQEAEALREADRLRVWRRYGYGSLIEYMEMEMGYTPRGGAGAIARGKGDCRVACDRGCDGAR